MLRKLILTLILTATFSVYLLPVQTAQAGIFDTATNFSSCAAGGYISTLISDRLVDLEKTVTESIKNWLIRKRVIRIPARFGISGFSPTGDSKVPVTDEDTQEKIDDLKNVYVAKEGVQDIIARCTAREILTTMGRNITNVARTGGRDGGPAWVRNWRNFQLESQYRGEGVFKGMLKSTRLCNYFGDDLKGQFQANKNVNLSGVKTRADGFDSFQVRGSCTLPNDFSYNDYKRDFSGNGGWEAWSRLMEPQNNYYGALFMSLDEANKQRAIEESAATNEVLANDGFLGIRGRNANDSCAVTSPFEGGARCLVYKDILTPGGIVGGAVRAGIETELQWVATSDELSEVIASGIEVLVNRLWNLSDENEGDYIAPGKLEIRTGLFPPPPPDEEEVPPEPTEFGNITVNFEIINDSGGTATASDFTFFIDGEPTAPGLVHALPVGEHLVVSGPLPDGYAFVGITGDCVGAILNLTENQSAACTIIYDDI